MLREALLAISLVWLYGCASSQNLDSWEVHADRSPTDGLTLTEGRAVLSQKVILSPDPLGVAILPVGRDEGSLVLGYVEGQELARRLAIAYQALVDEPDDIEPQLPQTVFLSGAQRPAGATLGVELEALGGRRFGTRLDFGFAGRGQAVRLNPAETGIFVAELEQLVRR